MQAKVTGAVLCVDDEPHILSALRRLFRTQGYEVLTADDGARGLAAAMHVGYLWREHASFGRSPR